MIVFVQRNIDIYVPNVFSPNGDGINDHLLISAGADVEEIETFTIFDRWGNMIYLNEHFLPNDPSEGWDGKRKGVALNPGVYAFRMIAHFSDGRSEVRYGDITLMR
jgi:gliding motility-associated-like protein